MNIIDLASKVLKIAETNKEGFTLNINTLTLVNTGIVASYKATQNSFTENDLLSVINHALNHDGIVGGWLNETDGKYYFDSGKVFKANDLAGAVAFGLNNDQLAIFDIDNMQEIRLNNEVVMAKEYSFSTFADWMLNIADKVVKHFKGDILIDAKKIVDLKNKHFFNSQRYAPQGFSLYWGIRETGTWLFHVEGINSFTPKEYMKSLGAENVYFITFWYDEQRNEIITVREVDKNTI